MNDTALGSCTAEAGERVTARYAEHVNPALVPLLGVLGYGRVFVRARGGVLYDDRGGAYRDWLAGFGATSLGHNPARIVARLKEALDAELPHVLHIGPSAAAADLAAALAERAPHLPLALFSLSGGEAVEAALKLARAATGRARIVACAGGFHGTGFAGLSLMTERRWQKPFEPLLPGCASIAFGDIDALALALRSRSVAAFVLEPIQGEGGVVMPPDGYLHAAQELCRRHGTLLVLDEVQTGVARSGRLFAYQHVPGFEPDIVVLGKALGAGMVPLAATLVRRDVHARAYGSLASFDLHGSTYAGNALSCIVGLEVLRAVDDEDLCSRAARHGRYLVERLERRLRGHALVREVRGRGLLVGIELGPTGRGVVQRLAPRLVEALARGVIGQWLVVRMLERGFVCQPASQAWNVIKLTPPLVVDEADIDAMVDALGDVLDEVGDLPTLCGDVTRRFGSQLARGWRFR
jgi:putrescine aminotransferase